MVQYLPPSQSDVGVLTLLNLLQDKEASSTRLKELTEATLATNKAIEASTVLQREVETKQKAVDVLVAKLEQDKIDHVERVKKDLAEVEREKKDLKVKHAQFSEQLEAHSKVKDALQKIKSDLDERELNIVSRERNATIRDSDLNKREAVVHEAEMKHQKRTEKLQEILKI